MPVLDRDPGLIVNGNLEAGCEVTVTFDRGMGRLADAELFEQNQEGQGGTLSLGFSLRGVGLDPRPRTSGKFLPGR